MSVSPSSTTSGSALFKDRFTDAHPSLNLPNDIHINDISKVYIHFLENHNLASGCYNAGFENISIIDLAKLIQDKVQSEIIITESNDPRSYRQDSSKLLSTGFQQKFGIQDAINDISNSYYNGNLLDNDSCYTVKWMKKINLNDVN